MAYRCVLAPSLECDGCEECKEYDENRYIDKIDKSEAEYDWYKEEQYMESIEREDCYDNI